MPSLLLILFGSRNFPCEYSDLLYYKSSLEFSDCRLQEDILPFLRWKRTFKETSLENWFNSVLFKYWGIKDFLSFEFWRRKHLWMRGLSCGRRFFTLLREIRYLIIIPLLKTKLLCTKILFNYFIIYFGYKKASPILLFYIDSIITAKRVKNLFLINWPRGSLREWILYVVNLEICMLNILFSVVVAVRSFIK